MSKILMNGAWLGGYITVGIKWIVGENVRFCDKLVLNFGDEDEYLMFNNTVIQMRN